MEIESRLREPQDLSAVWATGRRRAVLSKVSCAYHELKVQVLNWWHCGHSKVRSSVSSLRGIIVISVICVEHSGQAGRWVTLGTEGMRVVAGMRCTLTDRREPHDASRIRGALDLLKPSCG